MKGDIPAPPRRVAKKSDRPFKYTYRVRDDRPGHRWWVRLLLVTFSLLYLAGGLLAGMVFLSRWNALAQGYLAGFVDLPVNVPVTLPVNLVSTTDAPPDWGSKERVNILLVGMDRRPDAVGDPGRTDSMIVATLDPYSKTAGMLSIPRDLWVPIPLPDGRTMEQRINAAYPLGELNKYPGGGMALLRHTIEYNLGIRINYDALVEFEGFRKVIDAVDGILVDVKSPIRDDQYPTPDYGTKRVYIPAGLQWMDGETALEYARTRHQDSDFGRIQRQRQVLLAVRDRALQLNLLPKLPQLLLQLNQSIHTDLSVSEIVALARLAAQVDRDKIMSRAIESDAVQPVTTELGADILLPRRPAIESIVSEVFFDAQLKDEAPRVEIVVPPARANVGKALVDYFKRRGIAQSVMAMGDQSVVAQTRVLFWGPKKYSAGKVAELLGLPAGRVEQVAEMGPGVDVRVLLGTDVKLPGVT